MEILKIVLSAIIPVVITQVVVIIVTIINNRSTLKKLTIEKEAELFKTKQDIKEAHTASMNEIIERSDRTILLIETKLDALTKQVEKHNSLVERTYNLEASVKLIQAECARQSDKLDNIEDNVNELLKGVKL